MKTSKLINRFISNLIAFMGDQKVRNDENYNEIKIGLNMLIEISASAGPEEEMSLIMARLPEIKSLVVEKSQDFSADAKMLRLIDENFDNFFDEDARIERENSKEAKDASAFLLLIKQKDELLNSDLLFKRKLLKANQQYIRRNK